MIRPGSVVPRRGKPAQTALVKYDAARRAVAEAKSVDEVKAIRDSAVAMQAYARQVKDRQMEIDAAEIRIVAENGLGKMLIAAKEAGQIAEGRPLKNSSDSAEFSRVKLSEAGIDHKLSASAQKSAEMPEQKFKAAVKEWRKRNEDGTMRVTSNLRLAAERAATEAKTVSPPPKGKYGTIVIDPPWDMKKIERDVRPNQAWFDYQTMSEKELAAFDVAGFAAEDCHLFCWTTQKFLPMALRLVEAWGFRYVLLMVWHKPGGFQPIGLPQYNCEFAVYARRGAPKFIETKAFNCCFQAQRREHSRKPDEFYDLIRRVTAEPRIDVFSREPREGFSQHGNEAEKFAEAAA